MATFFGEIRPLSSRAVDDEEAEDQQQFTVSIEIIKEKTKPGSKLDLVIFAVGDIASAFAHSKFLFDNSDLIATLKYAYDLKNPSDALTSPKSTSKSVVSVYAASGGVILCQVSGSIPDEICFEATEILFENFVPEKVLILMSQHISFYRRERSQLIVDPVLKSLATSQYLAQHSCGIPRLNPPNFLSSMPASLLLKCETTKTPGLCIVNYVETHNVDSLVVEAFNDILKESILSSVALNSDAPERLQKYMKSKICINSNLYA